MIATTVVHATGVNWDGVLANVASITVILIAAGAVLVKTLKRSIGDQITDSIATLVTPKLDNIEVKLTDTIQRIARLEGMEEGKTQALAQAGVKKVGD